jgi:protein-S-isoprenylcysteine O-methyltransferase Ste14
VALETVESVVRWIGAAAALVFLAVAVTGLVKTRNRPAGRATGKVRRWSPLVALGLVIFIVTCIILWEPIPVKLTSDLCTAALILGALLYFPGLALYVRGRLAIGYMFGTSTTSGAQLYDDHKLVTRGPFALVRHPMYLGIILAATGGLLLYRTWTFALLQIFVVVLPLRARREERVLADEFGGEWEEYRRVVPAFIPFRFKRRDSTSGKGDHEGC